ncbi:hypothetical protein B0H14DRAFT_3006968, partial [Mycena olivaceomarginata]
CPHDARRRVLGASSLVSFWSSSLCLRCDHLTTISASATSDPPPTTSISSLLETLACSPRPLHRRKHEWRWVGWYHYDR